ncbi:uncharacterized protein TNCV_311401 [Trichonephila clavipes]|nr:uncharacterized protein TNCV_311401 [Trichonephila clavipes]
MTSPAATNITKIDLVQLWMIHAGLVIFQLLIRRCSIDTNAVTNLKLRDKSTPVKHQICNIIGDCLITKTIARVRTGHHRGMKFDRDGKRTHRNFDSCLDIELTTAYIFDCRAILAALQETGVLFSSAYLYVDNIQQIARTVIWAHGIV